MFYKKKNAAIQRKCGAGNVGAKKSYRLKLAIILFDYVMITPGYRSKT